MGDGSRPDYVQSLIIETCIEWASDPTLDTEDMAVEHEDMRGIVTVRLSSISTSCEYLTSVSDRGRREQQ